MTRIRSVGGFLVALLLSGCTIAQQAAVDPDAAYRAAVFDSAVYQRDHVRELRPLAATDGTVLVVTLHAFPLNAGPAHLEGDMWVTGVPEVRDLCRAFTGDKLARLHQLLGLPPSKRGDKAYFSTIRVPISALFRPALDPRVDTRLPCSEPPSATCGNETPMTATPDHIAWIANSLLGLHRWPNGYPWTHLGYTYDWGGNGPSAYGASEYIIRKGSDIEVTDVVTYVDYCKP